MGTDAPCDRKADGARILAGGVIMQANNYTRYDSRAGRLV